jgi:predicted ribosome-associated RNA-binding protein Tma20/translation initiation factor 1 (eIF-1/SUI1)
MSTSKITALDADRAHQLNILWHKPITSTHKSPVSGKDIKRLKQSILQHFTNMTVEQVDSIIPTNDKSKQLVCDKMSNKTLLYSVNNQPLFFDVTNGKHDLYPTLYMSWLLTDLQHNEAADMRTSTSSESMTLLPPIYVPSVVSPFLISGADLMLPGVYQANEKIFFGKWKTGQKRQIHVRGNSTHCIAICQLLVDSDYIQQHGWTGRAATILHVYSDNLYRLGDQRRPNDGFTDKRVYALKQSTLEVPVDDWEERIDEKRGEGEAREEEQIITVDASKHTAENVDIHDNNHLDAAGDVDKAAHPQDDIQPNDTITQQPSANAKDVDNVKNDMNQLRVNDVLDTATDKEASNTLDISRPSSAAPSSATHSDDETLDADSAQPTAADATRDTPLTPQLSREDMDKLLDNALFYAVQTRLAEADMLPITASQLMDTYMEPSHPCKHRLDVKQSNYKKLSIFLKSMQQLGVLTYKSKQNNEIHITSINATHPDVLSLVIDKQYNDAIKNKVKAQQRTYRKQAEALGLKASAVELQKQEAVNRIHILTKYRLTNNIRDNIPTFSEYNKSHLFTQQEARALLFQYIESLEIERSGSQIQLNDNLYHALWHNTAIQQRPATSSKGEIAKRFDNDLKAGIHHAIVKGDIDSQDDESDESILYKFTKGLPPSITVTLETRAGRKAVTRVSEFERYYIDADDLSVQMRKRFAGSSSVVEVPGGKSSKAKRDVIVQGNVTDQMPEWLNKTYYIPLSYITVLDINSKKR